MKVRGWTGSRWRPHWKRNCPAPREAGIGRHAMDPLKWMWAPRACAAALLWCSLCVGLIAPSGCRGGRSPDPRLNGIVGTPEIRVEQARQLFSEAAGEDLDPGRQDRSVPPGAREKYQRALKLLEG